jgi:hypothetical protein
MLGTSARRGALTDRPRLCLASYHTEHSRQLHSPLTWYVSRATLDSEQNCVVTTVLNPLQQLRRDSLFMGGRECCMPTAN